MGIKQLIERSIATLGKRIVFVTLLMGGGLLTAQSGAEPLHQRSAETCKICHQDIYKQWKGSMHANSTAFNDPIHATFYKKVIGDPAKNGVKMKNGKFPVCLNCHAPNAARDQVTKLDAMPAYKEGVNCIACHTLTNFKGVDAGKGKLRLGIKAYALADSIQSPGRKMVNGLEDLIAANDMFGGGGDEQKPNPHKGEDVEVDGQMIAAIPMEINATHMRSSDSCMGCHDKRSNSHGVPLCATGDEYEISEAKTDCLACHMPVNGDKLDHSMGGGHSVAMLSRSAILDLQTSKKGEAISVAVIMENLQPHSLPTGAPFRNIYMTLKAYDATGEEVWSSSKGHPAKDDKKAYLTYGLADKEGKPTSPPLAFQLGPDSRLKPFEVRTLNYEIPAAGVVLLRSELHYNLLWPGLVKKFKHLPKDLTAPTLIAAAEAHFKE